MASTLWMMTAALACRGVLAAADWPHDLTPLRPGPIAPLTIVEATYRFGWEKLIAAEGDFKISKRPDGLLELHGAAHSEGVVRSMWPFDLQHTSWRDDLLRPSGLIQTETYRRKVVKSWAGFRREDVDWRNEVTPGSEESGTKSRAVENALDPFTAYQLIRSQPLRLGERYRLLILPGQNLYLAEVTVIGPDPIKVEKAPRPAIKLSLTLQRVTDNLNLVRYGKFKQASVWLSDDPERIPLRAEADLFVGRVWAELLIAK